MTVKLVTIATYALPHEAHLARARLESGGIPAFVQDEHFSRIHDPLFGEVRLQVPADRAADALTLLAADPEDHHWEDGEWQVEGVTEEAWEEDAEDVESAKRGRNVRFPGRPAEATDPTRGALSVTTCPRCHSREGLETRRVPPPTWLAALLLGLPLLFPRRRTRCRACGAVFRA